MLHRHAPAAHRHHYPEFRDPACYNAPVKPAPFVSRSVNGVFGHSVARLEDQPLLTGRGEFVGDINFPHQLHMRASRSPYANAVLRDVDIATALAAPGVVAVWTSADIAELPPIDFRDPAAEALRPYRQPILAGERLRYVGEPVAAVFATGPYLAEDAAELVAVGLSAISDFRTSSICASCARPTRTRSCAA